MKTRATISTAVLLVAGCAGPRLQAPSPAADVGGEASKTAPRAREPDPAARGKPETLPPPTAHLDPAAWTNAHAVATQVGTYLVRWRATPEPLEQGTPFAIDACVFDARSPERLVPDVALDIDAGMPQHGHGLARQPRVTRQADGSWRAEGLRFHMLGRWELFFDVTRGALTERAQVSIPIE